MVYKEFLLVMIDFYIPGLPLVILVSRITIIVNSPGKKVIIQTKMLGNEIFIGFWIQRLLHYASSFERELMVQETTLCKNRFQQVIEGPSIVVVVYGLVRVRTASHKLFIHKIENIKAAGSEDT